MNLYGYQEEGAAWLNSGDFRYLADDMGLGKTIQALVAAVRRGVRRVRVICPASVVPNWYREYKQWGDPNWNFEAVSYAGRQVHGRTGKWDLIIADEAHYLKSSDAKRTKHVLHKMQETGAGMLLSGTPGRNASELWTLFDALWPELLKPAYRTEDQWRNYFCKWHSVPVSPYASRIKITGHQPAHLDELKGLMSKTILRRTLDDVAIQLPKLRVTLHSLAHDQVMFKAIQILGPELFDHLQDAAYEAASARVRRVLGQIKAPLIGDLLAEELADGQYEKIVVGYYHQDVGDALAFRLEKFGVVRIGGKTPMKMRQAFIDRFNTDPKTRVFIGQMTAAGVGLNLQDSCSEVALVEPDWTPDPNRQFLKRVHRIGQTRPVRARVFGVAGTLDTEVMNNIALNAQLTEEIGL